MGAYARWLKYHPGNVAFQSVVLENANYYQSYHGLPKVFQEHILFNVVDRVIERRNRFLKQEPSTGTWMVMSFEEARQHAHLELTTCNRSRLSSLLQAFRSLSANYRFGRFRQTKLSRIAVSFLSQLQTLLLRTAPESHTNSISQAELQPNCTVMWRHVKPTFALTHNILARPHILRQFSLKKVPSPTGMDSNLRAGDVVICNFDGRSTPLQGSITNAWSDGLFDVAFSDGDIEYNLKPSQLSKYVPVDESAPVLVYGHGNDEWRQGVISRVMPNGEIDVVYEDGEKDVRVGSPYYRLCI
jgi:hypothetical protein